MNYLKNILLTAFTVVVMASPAFATQPDNPVCNPRNCDNTQQMSELPDPECVGKECEINTTEELPKPLCRYPNCRPNPTMQ